ncbi:hypothetical protein [Pelosinus baikalensis]|uniref:Uncharacterized protein n=1 Tax=Pelosinus baikalensis TaxID=2892015 RepID=A0ABS8HYN0_9FIRM|nr:hypothetical protein [Pelosinus baikalensis]MCC5467348.1 hypothetical protein [Pelosinus baikalensis]
MAENRDLKATPGIPEKNRVDSEPSTKEIINQIETAVKNSVTEKKRES